MAGRNARSITGKPSRSRPTRRKLPDLRSVRTRIEASIVIILRPFARSDVNLGRPTPLYNPIFTHFCTRTPLLRLATSTSHHNTLQNTPPPHPAIIHHALTFGRRRLARHLLHTPQSARRRHLPSLEVPPLSQRLQNLRARHGWATRRHEKRNRPLPRSLQKIRPGHGR